MSEQLDLPLRPRPPEFSVTRTRVLKGRVVIAWLRPASRRGGVEVWKVGGGKIGRASTPAEAMLMAARHMEAPRC